MQRNGARNRTKRTGISLGHASSPEAPLGCRSFRPRRQDGGWQRTPPHHNWQQELKKHTAGTGTRRFFTRKYRLIPGVSSDARGQRERQNGSSSIQTRREIAGRPRRFGIFAWEPGSRCGCAGRTAEYSGGSAGRAAAASGGARGEREIRRRCLALISLEYSRQLWLPCDRLTRPVTTASPSLLLLELWIHGPVSIPTSITDGR
jgi:hypothetical protein